MKRARSFRWWRSVLVSATVLSVAVLVTKCSADDSVDDDVNLYVDAVSGNDANDGMNGNPVKTIARAMELVREVARPLKRHLNVNLNGTFVGERIRPRQEHFTGTNSQHRLKFQSTDKDDPARLLGGVPLNFVKAADAEDVDLDLSSFPASVADELWVAKAPQRLLDELATAPSAAAFRWRDVDCRKSVPAPPALSVNGHVMTRAREPNLPAAKTSAFGETRDAWLRTGKRSVDSGAIHFVEEDRKSIDLASDKSWDSGDVTVHMFPTTEWYDARVRVRKGSRSSDKSSFDTWTNQISPGNLLRDEFEVKAGARYYLEGALEYLDEPGEYHVDLETGTVLFYPPSDVDLENEATAVLSLYEDPIVHFADEWIMMAFVGFYDLHMEGSRKHLVQIERNNCIEFKGCTFVNAGHDSMVVSAHHVFIKDCDFRGSGGSAIDLKDFRNLEEHGPEFGLMPSKNLLADSRVSHYGTTCRHYSEGVVLGGNTAVVANNHFHSSTLPAVGSSGGGGYHILHNVFSRVADGTYDTGVLHWGAVSPMERGNEIAYNVFFRNGVSKEPCHEDTNCVVADVYLDGGASGTSIHGNVFVKDKVKQSVAADYDHHRTVQWVGVYANGGADLKMYENVFVGPEDVDEGVLEGDGGILFVQTSGATLYAPPDAEECGHTGVCEDDDLYRTMKEQKWNEGAWRGTFPELSKYEMPDPASDWFCADEPSCPLAPWNNTVSCNVGLASDEDDVGFGDRAVWPTDERSPLRGNAEAGTNVPERDEALREFGNDARELDGYYDTRSMDELWKSGEMDDLLNLAAELADKATADAPYCRYGLREFATRPDLAGPYNNDCAQKWSKGLAVCDPCDRENGDVVCAARDLPDGQCACDDTHPSDRHKEFVRNFVRKRGHHRNNNGDSSSSDESESGSESESESSEADAAADLQETKVEQMVRNRGQYRTNSNVATARSGGFDGMGRAFDDGSGQKRRRRRSFGS